MSMSNKHIITTKRPNKMQKDNYTYTIDGRILFIEDTNINTSVTNDIENILASISKMENTSISNFDVIYRDSNGTIDGIHTKDNIFVKFYHIGQKTYHTAKLKIKPLTT